MPAAHSEPPTATPPEADGGLRCPHCDYNLTGLNESRCPECGNSFDSEELRSRSAHITPSPIRGWNDGVHSWPIAFAWMCLLTWFAPWRVGRGFPHCYRRRSAAVFRWIALVVAFGLGLALGGLVRTSANRRLEAWLDWLFLLICWTVGALLCEGLVTAQLALTTEETSPPGRFASTSWSGLVGFFRSFLILSVACAVLVESISPIIVLCLWWWAALSLGVAFRDERHLERLIAMVFMVPIAVVVSAIGVYAILGSLVVFAP